MVFSNISFLWVRIWTRFPHKVSKGTSRHFGIFIRFIKVKEYSLCRGSCSRLGPLSKLQGLEKWESNAWLFVNCLASPWVQPEFVSKKKNKVTWTFSWLSPLPLLSSHRSWQPSFHRASDERGSLRPANSLPPRLGPSLEMNIFHHSLYFPFFMYWISAAAKHTPDHKSASCAVKNYIVFMMTEKHSKSKEEPKQFVRDSRPNSCLTVSSLSTFEELSCGSSSPIGGLCRRNWKSFHCSDRENDSNLHHGIYSQMCWVQCIRAGYSL